MALDLGQQFNELVTKLEQEEKTREERLVRLKHISINQRGQFVYETWDEAIPLSPVALEQLCREFNLPVSYFSYIMKENPIFVAEQINWFVSNEPRDIVRKVRIKNGRIQAFVSERYEAFDHLDLLNAMDKVSDQLPEGKLQKLILDDRIMSLRITFPDQKKEFGEDIRGQRDEIFAGFDIHNSEVGLRSISVAPMVWRLICSNGMRGRVKSDELRQRHAHFDFNTFNNELKGAIQGSLTAGNETLNELNRAKSVPFSIEENLEDVSQRFRIGKKDQATIIENFAFDPERTLYGFVNAVTRTARDMPHHKRETMEETAQKILVNY